MSVSCSIGTVQPEREIVGALLSPAETAAYFGVSVKTLQRWDKSGKIHSVRTLGGHRRFREAEVIRLRNQPAVFDDGDDDLPM